MSTPRRSRCRRSRNTTVALIKPDGTSFGSASLYAKNTYQPSFQYQGSTSSSTGQRTLPLPEGDYTIRVKDYNTGASLVDYSGTITAADEGTASTITITVGANSGTISGRDLRRRRRRRRSRAARCS